MLLRSARRKGRDYILAKYTIIPPLGAHLRRVVLGYHSVLEASRQRGGGTGVVNAACKGDMMVDQSLTRDWVLGYTRIPGREAVLNTMVS